MVGNNLDKLKNSENDLKENNAKGTESEDFFKSLLKTYTDQELYPLINALVTKGKYEQLQGYFSLLLKNLKLFGPSLSYKTFTAPIYRGFNPLSPYYKVDDYKRNSIGMWTTF